MNLNQKTIDSIQTRKSQDFLKFSNQSPFKLSLPKQKLFPCDSNASLSTLHDKKCPKWSRLLNNNTRNPYKITSVSKRRSPLVCAHSLYKYDNLCCLGHHHLLTGRTPLSINMNCNSDPYVIDKENIFTRKNRPYEYFFFHDNNLPTNQEHSRRPSNQNGAYISDSCKEDLFPLKSTRSLPHKQIFMMTKETGNESLQNHNLKKRTKSSKQGKSLDTEKEPYKSKQNLFGRKQPISPLNNLTNSIKLFSEFSQKLSARSKKESTSRKSRRSQKKSKESNKLSKKSHRVSKQSHRVSRHSKNTYKKSSSNNNFQKRENELVALGHYKYINQNLFQPKVEPPNDSERKWELSKYSSFIYQNKSKIDNIFNFNYKGTRLISKPTPHSRSNSLNLNTSTNQRKKVSISNCYNLSSSNSMYGYGNLSKHPNLNGYCVLTESLDDETGNFTR